MEPINNTQACLDQVMSVQEQVANRTLIENYVASVRPAQQPQTGNVPSKQAEGPSWLSPESCVKAYNDFQKILATPTVSFADLKREQGSRVASDTQKAATRKRKSSTAAHHQKMRKLQRNLDATNLSATAKKRKETSAKRHELLSTIQGKQNRFVSVPSRK